MSNYFSNMSLEDARLVTECFAYQVSFDLPADVSDLDLDQLTVLLREEIENAGDTKIEKVYENSESITVVSVDSSIEVLTNIPRNKDFSQAQSLELIA
jgi:hypothetical protein